jgi:hypothetical protein
MGRLIFVPQYPTKLRYQEWWISLFQDNLQTCFEKVITLGKVEAGNIAFGQDFAPFTQSIQFELLQIEEYLALELLPGDILLLNDLSYPGLFSQVLLHKRPSKCFAICHATSKNKYDYFAKDRNIKYPIEKATSKLFTKIFVGSNYHAKKLGWDNVEVAPLPFPPMKPYEGLAEHARPYKLVTVSRRGIQKHNMHLEKEIESLLNLHINTKSFDNWFSYYRFLGHAKVLLITSKEETYGYQVIDAVKNGCIPIAPAKYSYPELLPPEYLYTDKTDLVIKLKQALTGELSVPTLLVEETQKEFFNILINEFKNNA